MPGFFKSSEISTRRSQSLVPKCGSCGLYAKCNSPKMKPTGKGNLGILIVAEAPGQKEDERNIQLIGPAGQKLRECLKSIGHSLDRDFWKTNAVICRPPKNKMDDRYITACRPNLTKTLQELKPHTVILLGGKALTSFMMPSWKEKPGAVERWAGWQIPLQKPNMWVCPTYHPSYIMRQSKDRVLENLFTDHLRQAIKRHHEPPWRKIPDYKSRLEIIYRPSLVAKYIYDSVKSATNKTLLTYDLETNSLKPEFDGTEIVSCSMHFSHTDSCIAFPWNGDVTLDAVAYALKSPLRKVGANIKFEHRWIRNKLGISTRKWFFDTVLAAHVLDNREGVTGVKFQSLVTLGLESYNEDIEPYLVEAKTGSYLNRIRELPLDDLLEYNGMDSIVEHDLAIAQMKQIARQQRMIERDQNEAR